jgi:DNA-binding Lrp family transcriptional regulator
MRVDDKDKALLALLQANSRESTSELARKLNLSRSTVKDRIARLERQGVIKGYTLRYSEEFEESQILAHVMISSNAKFSAAIVRKLRAMPALKSLYAVNGVYDMIAVVSAESTRLLDEALDAIGEMEGVEKTVSSIILSTKFER